LILLHLTSNEQQEISIVSSDGPKTEYTELPEIMIEPLPVLAIQTNDIDLLENHIDAFFEAGKEYGVDPYLMLAIADLESVFGKRIPYGSYNPFGRTCGKEYRCVFATDATTKKELRWNAYENWNSAIFDEAKYLRTRYYDRGLDTPYKINTIYAEDKLWHQKVLVLMEKWKTKLLIGRQVIIDDN
jgi:beta-N-acetylglucosaminidase